MPARRTAATVIIALIMYALALSPTGDAKLVAADAGLKQHGISAGLTGFDEASVRTTLRHGRFRGNVLRLVGPLALAF
jgi:hypothetical protein